MKRAQRNAVRGSAAAMAGSTWRSGAIWNARWMTRLPSTDATANPARLMSRTITVSGLRAAVSPRRKTASRAKQTPAAAPMTTAVRRPLGRRREVSSAPPPTAATTSQTIAARPMESN